MFFFEVYGDHRDLHVLTHSFPTRRSSDLLPSGVTLSDSGAGYAIFNVETLNGVGIVDFDLQVQNVSAVEGVATFHAYATAEETNKQDMIPGDIECDGGEEIGRATCRERGGQYG